MTFILIAPSFLSNWFDSAVLCSHLFQFEIPMFKQILNHQFIEFKSNNLTLQFDQFKIINRNKLFNPILY